MAWSPGANLGAHNYGFGKLRNLLQPKKQQLSYVPPGAMKALSPGRIATSQRRAGTAMAGFSKGSKGF